MDRRLVPAPQPQPPEMPPLETIVCMLGTPALASLIFHDNEVFTEDEWRRRCRLRLVPG